MNPTKLCKKIPVRYAVFSCILPATLYLLYSQSRPLSCPQLPQLPEAAAAPAREEQPGKAEPMKPLRDPFRPLNHPAAPASLPRATVAAPLSGLQNQQKKQNIGISPAQSYRLCGIVTVNSRSKALLRNPSGSLLLGPGDVLPGAGTIESVTSSGIVCSGKKLAIGEVWQ